MNSDVQNNYARTIHLKTRNLQFSNEDDALCHSPEDLNLLGEGVLLLHQMDGCNFVVTALLLLGHSE